MKLIKRLATAIVILAVMALPMASLAEGVKSFSFGNLSIDALGTAMNIGATLGVQTSSKDGRDMITITILGGESGKDEIGTVYLSMGDDGVKATLKGLSEAFSITKDEINQFSKMYAEQAAAQTAGQVDPALFQDLMDSYSKLLLSQKDAAKLKEQQLELGVKLLAYMGDRCEMVGEESYEVFDKSYTGQRVKFTLNMDDIDKIMDIMAESDENAKKFLDSYFKLLSSVMASQGMDGFDSLSGMYKALNVNFTCDVDMITDMSGDAVKADLTINTTQGDTTVTIPMQMQTLNGADGQRVCVIIDTAIEGIPMFMDIDATQSATDGSFNFVMNAGPEDEKVDMTMDMTSAKKDGKENFKLAFNFAMNGQQMASGEIAYDGTAAMTGSGSAHEGKLSIAGNVAGYGSASFSADLAYSNEPKGEADFSVLDSLPVVTISELSDEKQQAVMSEAEVIGIKALGVLMQTPGVAEIVSTVMAAAQAASPEVSEYGYEDYSSEGENIEDIEDWQEIEGLDSDIPA